MSFRSIGENVSELKRDFAYEEGYFGKKGKSSTNSRVRNIESSDPKTTAKIFYDKIAFGGKESNIYNRSGEIVGKKTKLSDGSVVSWREISSSDGSPAVEINIEKSTNSAGLKQQKIHFVKD